MNNYLIVFSVLFIVVCRGQEKGRSNPDYPFNDISIDSVLVEYKIPLQKNLLDKESQNNLKIFLEKVKKSSLIRGKRLHGAQTVLNLRLFTREAVYLINIKSHKDEGVTASFFENKNDSKFKNYMGRLYNAESILDLLP